MLTAVTQFDCNGRTVQTCRETCFCRSISSGGGDNVIKSDVELTQKSVLLSSSTKIPILLRQLSSEATQSKRHYSSQRKKSNEIVQTEEESLKEVCGDNGSLI